MITNTNMGSVKLRLSMYAVASVLPMTANMKTMSTMAQKPKTTSTSPNKCQMPAWRGWVWASRSKNLVEKVWTTANANRVVPMI